MADEKDDLASLFGDDDFGDSAPLFMGGDDPESSTSPDCEWGFLQSAAHSAPHILLPEPQPALTLPRLTLPAVPDPPGAFLSPQVGHTSGDNVVSSQHFSHIGAIAESASEDQVEHFDENELEASLLGLWHATPGGEPHVDTPAVHHDADVEDAHGTNVSDHDHPQPTEADDAHIADAAQQSAPLNPVAQNQGGQEVDFVRPSQIPGYRFAGSGTNVNEKLPRRIDLVPGEIDKLVNFITLSKFLCPSPRRERTLNVLWGYCEFSEREGQLIGNEIREILADPFYEPMIQQPDRRIAETKKAMLETAFVVLHGKGLGYTWFSEHRHTDLSRTFFWPQDSTLVLFCFSQLVYKYYCNKRQKYQTRARAALEAEQRLRGMPGPSQGQPAAAESLERAASPAQAIDTGSEISSAAGAPQKASNETSPEGVATPASRLTNSPDDVTSPPPMKQPSDSAVTIKNVAALTGHTTPAPAEQFPSAESLAILKSRVEDIAAAKQPNSSEPKLDLVSTAFKAKVPADANLGYHIYFKSRVDGSDVAAPLSFQHTDHNLSQHAFPYLRSLLENAGYEPTFIMTTPLGRMTIENEEAWDRAICFVYNLRRAGGNVEVDVYI
ncbi:hypothetical protein VTJ49DRAFT_803 [Mycothermus thermophilus]|uniref:Uncharacterized protein n=1 Tax=Humicola insolens TaxID=85995 RepID=A0ABR3VFP3_HUMIN